MQARRAVAAVQKVKVDGWHLQARRLVVKPLPHDTCGPAMARALDSQEHKSHDVSGVKQASAESVRPTMTPGRKASVNSSSRTAPGMQTPASKVSQGTEDSSESQTGRVSANFQVHARLTPTNINTAHRTSNKQISTGKRLEVNTLQGFLWLAREVVPLAFSLLLVSK